MVEKFNDPIHIGYLSHKKQNPLLCVRCISVTCKGITTCSVDFHMRTTFCMCFLWLITCLHTFTEQITLIDKIPNKVTHWGVCVCFFLFCFFVGGVNWLFIGSGNGKSTFLLQAITWLSVGSLGTYFTEIQKIVSEISVLSMRGRPVAKCDPLLSRAIEHDPRSHPVRDPALDKWEHD